MPPMPGMPPQTFSPDGSPVHQVQGGYAPPVGMGPIPGGSMPPGQGMDPAAMAGPGQMGGMPPPSSQQQMYIPQGSQIPGGQGQYQPAPVSTSYSNLPGSYQNDGQSYPQYSMSPPSTGGPLQQNVNTATQPQGVGTGPQGMNTGPPQGVNTGYVPQQNLDYQAFNMQGKFILLTIF